MSISPLLPRALPYLLPPPPLASISLPSLYPCPRMSALFPQLDNNHSEESFMLLASESILPGTTLGASGHFTDQETDV